MGNNAIFSVLGLMVFFGIINTTLNSKNAQSTQNIATYVSTNAAQEIAYDGLSIARLQIDSGFAATNSFSLAGNLRGGTYAVNVTAGKDSIWVQSTGVYEGISYTAQANLFHHVKFLPAPKYLSALRFQATPTGVHTSASNYQLDYSISDTALIDGREHDWSGNFDSSKATIAADVSALIADDSTRLQQYSTSLDRRNGNVQPVYQRLKTDPTTTNLAYVDSLAAHADFVISTAHVGQTLYPSPATWGNSNNPAIVFANAGYAGSIIKFDSTYSGWGVLVARGDVEFLGKLKWNGYLIAYNNSGSYTLKIGGDSTMVVGAVVLLNGSSSGNAFRLRNRAKILYSTATLDVIKVMPKLTKYFVNPVAQWYE